MKKINKEINGKENEKDSNSNKSSDIQFIDKLKSLKKNDHGAFTALKRAAGSSIAESRQGAIAAFYKILSISLMNSKNEEIYFLIATLYGHNDEYHFAGDFGETMRLVKNKFDSESTDRRMTNLLDSNFELSKGKIVTGGELAYKLRQLVKLSKSKDVGISWSQLLKDLRNWNHPDKFVQKKWAREYFGYKKSLE